jgi:predicted nucleotidyltransferase
MLTDKQLDIFTAFVKFPFKERARQEVKVLSNEKSNNALSLAFSQFKKENLLVEQKVGKSSLYKLNLDNHLVYYYIALCNDKRLKQIVKFSLAEVFSEVKKVTSFFTIVVFGSYALGEEKKSSDLDVAIIIEDKSKVKDVERNLSSAELKSVIGLDAHVIVRDDFFEMLINDEENLGKQIAKKHLTVYNHQLFYDLVLEGVKNGFRY